MLYKLTKITASQSKSLRNFTWSTLPTPLPFKSFKKLFNQFNVFLIQGFGEGGGDGVVRYLRKRLYQGIIALYILGTYTKEPCSKTNYIKIFLKKM